MQRIVFHLAESQHNYSSRTLQIVREAPGRSGCEGPGADGHRGQVMQLGHQIASTYTQYHSSQSIYSNCCACQATNYASCMQHAIFFQTGSKGSPKPVRNETEVINDGRPNKMSKAYFFHASRVFKNSISVLNIVVVFVTRFVHHYPCLFITPKSSPRIYQGLSKPVSCVSLPSGAREQRTSETTLLIKTCRGIKFDVATHRNTIVHPPS
eukprot:8284487-Pyramimonas_sp.AAC.1